MNTIAFETLVIKFPDSYFDTLIEESIKTAKLAELRADIGEKLFNQLSEEDKSFIIETEGMINLGYEASEEDLKKIFKYIEEYED
jgi:hypothetical protein